MSLGKGGGTDDDGGESLNYMSCAVKFTISCLFVCFYRTLFLADLSFTVRCVDAQYSR